MKESTSAADGGNHRERALGDYFLSPFSFPSKIKRYCSRANRNGRNCWGVREYILMFPSSSVLTQLIKDVHSLGHWYLTLFNPGGRGGTDLPPPCANAYTSKKSMGGNSDKFCIFLNVCFLLVKQLPVLSGDHWIGQKRLIFIRC